MFPETISSPPPLAFWERETIGVGGGGEFFLGSERVGNTPLWICDLAAARQHSRQVDAFMFWSRAPVLDRREDGSYRLSDARYYSVADGRFSVTVPADYCQQ